jgi:membrane-bound lytic murein transglycosylase
MQIDTRMIAVCRSETTYQANLCPFNDCSHPTKQSLSQKDDVSRQSPQSRQLTVAKKTVEKHVLHWHQLYEQQKKKKATYEEIAFVLDRYVKRWQRWAAAGLQGIKLCAFYERNLNPLNQHPSTRVWRVPVQK